MHIEMIKLGAPHISDPSPNKQRLGLQFAQLKKLKMCPQKGLGSFVETSGATSVMSAPVSRTDSCFPFSPSPFLDQILDKYIL